MMKDPADIATLREALAKDPQNTALLAELESPAYRARIERLENLQTEIDRMMQEIYGREKSVTSEHYANVFHNSYYRNIYEIQRAAGFQFSFSAAIPRDAVPNPGKGAAPALRQRDIIPLETHYKCICVF